MSLLLAGAARIERAAGARAALHAYRAIAQRGPSADSALAHLAALRCAAEVQDEPAFQQLLLSWPEQPGAHAERVAALAHRLATQGRTGLARILLEAERSRWSDAERRSPNAGLATYLAAALAPAEGRAALLRRLLEHAPTPALRAKTELRLAELERARMQTARAAERARTIPTTTLTPPERLRRAELLLLAGSRFQRAAGFGELAELVAHDEKAAMRLALRGLCCRLPLLTPLEEDRARAVFARLPNEAARERWLGHVDELVQRARNPEAPATSGEGGAGSALDLQWLHVTLHDLLGRLRSADAGERGPLERRFAELLAMGAAPAAGFLPFAAVVQDPALRRDLVFRAEAAGEPQAKRALLDLVHLEADALVRAEQLGRAYRLTERAVAAQRTGDFAEVRDLLGS